jgi:hypothetical protein
MRACHIQQHSRLVGGRRVLRTTAAGIRAQVMTDQQVRSATLSPHKPYCSSHVHGHGQSALLQAFTIIGGGRVGQALAQLGSGKDVSRSSRALATYRTNTRAQHSAAAMGYTIHSRRHLQHPHCTCSSWCQLNTHRSSATCHQAPHMFMHSQ